MLPVPLASECGAALQMSHPICGPSAPWHELIPRAGDLSLLAAHPGVCRPRAQPHPAPDP